MIHFNANDLKKIAKHLLTDFIGFHAFVRFWNSKENEFRLFFFFATCCHFLNAEVGGEKKRQKDGRGAFSKVVVRKFWSYRNYE